ncbi:MAG: hypothetical protein ABIH76_03605 [Candidatus Bathyarchaeota archaeon]
MQPPCEIIVKHILPSIRAMVAKELIENYNLTQVHVAQKMGTSQAAISWYLMGKRGRADKKGYCLAFMEKNSEVKSWVKEIAKEITGKQLTSHQMAEKLCKVCPAIRKAEEFCELQKM